MPEKKGSKSIFMKKIILAHLIFLICVSSGYANQKLQSMHNAAVILKAIQLFPLAGYPIEAYRLIANHSDKAKLIPFQIDEVASNEDFILPSGPNPNTLLSNNVFDGIDEISFMGEDVGLSSLPSEWSFKKPSTIYRIDARIGGVTRGSVFLGVYPNKKVRPPLSKKRYVNFDLKGSFIQTEKYRYKFNPENYLVVKGIEVIDRNGKPKPIVYHSSFYIEIDLKYFLTLRVGHSDISSNLEAYKTGPIRTIVRVNFSYNFLKLNFEMGMYTEVSFFSNSVLLPTIMYNPLNGSKSLNDGSGFYYGFATTFDTKKIDIKSNLERYKRKDFFNLFSMKKSQPKVFKLQAIHEDFLMLMEIAPSWKMLNMGNKPVLYQENGDPLEINKRRWDDTLPLGKSPVNLGVYFNLNDFRQGEHRMGFKLYFDNNPDQAQLEKYTDLSKWFYTATKITGTKNSSGGKSGN